MTQESQPIGRDELARVARYLAEQLTNVPSMVEIGDQFSEGGHAAWTGTEVLELFVSETELATESTLPKAVESGLNATYQKLRGMTEPKRTFSGAQYQVFRQLIADPLMQKGHALERLRLEQRAEYEALLPTHIERERAKLEAAMKAQGQEVRQVLEFKPKTGPEGSGGSKK